LLLSTDSSSAVVSRLRHRPIEAAAFIATVKLLAPNEMHPCWGSLLTAHIFQSALFVIKFGR
jgi:hypothetical protein